ncbi:MAG: hypothetical protein HS115_15530 [Spirochaetales bacterium]|nr:hypothetical protein [Spirochaetales bacterium]
MTRQDYGGLCLDFLKADALTIAASSDLPLRLPDWLRRFSLPECKPGTMDGIVLGEREAPRSLRDILDQTALLSPGGILVFAGPLPADFRANDLSGSGLNLRHRDSTFVVIEKEYQAHHAAGRQFTIFFPFLSGADAQETLKQLSRWQTYFTATFLPGVAHFLLINDQALDNTAQHVLQNLNLPADLIHHYRPAGEETTLQTALLHNQGRFFFWPADLSPQRSWPLWQLSLLGEAPEYCELDLRQPPIQKNSKHPISGSLQPLRKIQSFSLKQPFLLSAARAFDLARQPVERRASFLNQKGDLQKMVIYL